MPSFRLYDEKNTLVEVARDPKKRDDSTTLSMQKGIKTMTLVDLRSLLKKPAIKATNPQAESVITNTEQSEQYTAAEIKALSKLQRRWKSWFPCIDYRRAWLQTTEGQVVARYIGLGSKYLVLWPVPHPIRRILVQYGIAAQTKLTDTRRALSARYEQVMATLEQIDTADETSEALDNAISGLRKLDKSLKVTEEHMSDENLRRLVNLHDPDALQTSFAVTVEKAESIMLEIAALKGVLESTVKGADVPTTSMTSPQPQAKKRLKAEGKEAGYKSLLLAKVKSIGIGDGAQR